MNDEFPVIVIEVHQTCSFMQNVISALQHVSLFMDWI